MIKYPDKTKQEALETYRREGIKAACERYHVPSSTIYRWLAIEKRETLLTNVEQQGSEPSSEENKDENNHTTTSDPILLPQDDDSDASEKELLEMVTLLSAENEKLRAMNLQLRKALQVFVL